MSVATDFVRWASAPPSWLTSTEDELEGRVLASRVRVARNKADAPFPHRAPAALQKRIVAEATELISSHTTLGPHHAFNLEKLSEMERRFLVERHVISHQHVTKPHLKGLIVSAGENVSVMVNEEDHLRVACFRPGLNLTEAWHQLSELDDQITPHFSTAYHPHYGFITACPTNMGTGLRASCLVHLPATAWTGKIQELIKELERFELIIRGFYGEGTEAIGDIFQISSGATLGRTELHMIKDVEKAVRFAVNVERKQASQLMLAEHRLAVEDRAHRAFGTLKTARLLNDVEAMKCLSLLKLARQLNLEGPWSDWALNKLIFLTQPIHVLLRGGGPAKKGPDEALRAEEFRKLFPNL